MEMYSLRYALKFWAQTVGIYTACLHHATLMLGEMCTWNGDRKSTTNPNHCIQTEQNRSAQNTRMHLECNGIDLISSTENLIVIFWVMTLCSLVDLTTEPWRNTVTLLTMKMTTIRSSEKLLLAYQTIWCHNLEEDNTNLHCREKFKPYPQKRKQD
jgi:hypothetical protein